MSAETAQPAAMVVFASEQLWPNIHGVVHWHDQVDDVALQHVFIYFTDSRKSSEPARRLARFCHERYPDLNVHLPGEPLGQEPADVARQIRAWHAATPDLRWIINATGGLKLMFAGVVSVLGTAGMEVVYREFTGWYRLEKRGQEIVSQTLEIPSGETDEIPVIDLIKAQWQPAADQRINSETPSALNVAGLVGKGIEHGWKWKRMFRALGYDDSSGAGFLFEKFVAAALLELGVKQLQQNVELHDAGGQPLQEVDLVANHGGRLLVLDCKIISKQGAKEKHVEPLTSQIRQGEATRESLGGRGAKLVLIRPGWTFTEGEQMLAAASGLDVIGPSRSWRLFTELARLAGCGALPPPLEQAEQKIRRWGEQTGAPFPFIPSRRKGRSRKDGSFELVLNLDRQLLQMRQELGQDWDAFRVGSRVTFHAAKPDGADLALIRSAVAEAFADVGRKVERCTRSGERSVVFTLHLRPGVNAKALDKQLRPFVGRSLIAELLDGQGSFEK